MRVVRVPGINLDLFLGPAVGIPAWLDSKLRKHGMCATHIVVAGIIELSPAVLQLDCIVGVHGYTAERVANWDPKAEGEKIDQVQDGQPSNNHDELAFHLLNDLPPDNCKSANHREPSSRAKVSGRGTVY